MPVAPVPGTISHKFGEDRRTRRHNGVDYLAPKGTPVKASVSGLVVRSTFHEPTERIVIGKKGKKEKKFTGSYGNVIIIYHGQDRETRKYTYTLYAHLDGRSVGVKEEVQQGQVIGSSGRTGTRQEFYNRKGGYELHFEVIKSSEELTWVKAGNLDYHFAAENKRKDPVIFLSTPFGVSSRAPVPYYKLPAGLDFKKNLKEARGMGSYEFASAARPGGRWDMRHTYGNSGLAREHLTNLGNYNYGLTGTAAGMPAWLLHGVGAWDQVAMRKWKPEYGPRPSDNPNDTYWINQGIKDYEARSWE